jgi:hypothetical protein
MSREATNDAFGASRRCERGTRHQEHRRDDCGQLELRDKGACLVTHVQCPLSLLPMTPAAAPRSRNAPVGIDPMNLRAIAWLLLDISRFSQGTRPNPPRN